jgi:hypothetical protein
LDPIPLSLYRITSAFPAALSGDITPSGTDKYGVDNVLISWFQALCLGYLILYADAFLNRVPVTTLNDDFSRFEYGE